MTHSRVQWQGWRCKLCSSGAACDIFTPTEAEMNGFDTFSDDPDICDACIHLNYAKRWRWGTPEQWFALTVGQYLAFFVSLILVLRHSQFHGFWRLVGYWLRMLLLLVVVCVVGVWIVTRVLYWLLVPRVRSSIPQGNRTAEGERLYWLAVWGRITGRKRYSTRMLRRAMKLGAPDVRHLLGGT